MSHSFSFTDVDFTKIIFDIQAVEGSLIPDVAIFLRAEEKEVRYYYNFSADEDSKKEGEALSTDMGTAFSILNTGCMVLCLKEIDGEFAGAKEEVGRAAIRL